jgi:hypothetical protein
MITLIFQTLTPLPRLVGFAQYVVRAVKMTLQRVVSRALFVVCRSLPTSWRRVSVSTARDRCSNDCSNDFSRPPLYGARISREMGLLWRMQRRLFVNWTCMPETALARSEMSGHPLALVTVGALQKHPAAGLPGAAGAQLAPRHARSPGCDRQPAD